MEFLHYISNYIPYMGMTLSPWDDLSLTLKGKVTYGAIGCAVDCAKWIMASFHHIGTAIYTPMAEAIDAALYKEPIVDLQGPFTADDSIITIFWISKDIYLTATYVGMFL